MFKISNTDFTASLIVFSEFLHMVIMVNLGRDLYLFELDTLKELINSFDIIVNPLP